MSVFLNALPDPLFAWTPRVSVLAANLGHVDQNYPEIDNSPNVQVGVGVQPPLKYGTLEVGVDYKKLKQESETPERLYYGSIYTLGAMQLTGGFNSDNINGGVLFALNAISVGITYSSTKIPGGVDDGAYTQTVYTQFGFQM